MEPQAMCLSPVYRSLLFGLAIATSASACARSVPDPERTPAMSEATQTGRTLRGYTYTDAPVDVQLGPHTFRIPANYLDSQIAPWPGEGVTLVIEWPGMTPTAPGARAHPRTNDFRKEISVAIRYVDRVSIDALLERRVSTEARTNEHAIERMDPRRRLDLRIPQATTFDLIPYTVDIRKMDAYIGQYTAHYGTPPGHGPASEDLWYVARGPGGSISTFIKCDSPQYRGDGVRLQNGDVVTLEGEIAAGCVHYMVDVENSLSISFHYKRAFLPDWKGMETSVRSLLADAKVR